MSHQVQKDTQGSPPFLLWSILRKLYFRSDSPFPGQQLVLLQTTETTQESREDIPETPGKDARSITGLYKTGTSSHYQGKAAGRHKHCPMQCIPLQVKHILFSPPHLENQEDYLHRAPCSFLSQHIKWTLLARGFHKFPEGLAFIAHFSFL